MGWYIVKQPDGRYARFSEIVDDFTHRDMTREEIAAVCRQQPGMGSAETEQKISTADRLTGRWGDTLALMESLGKKVPDAGTPTGEGETNG